MKLITFFLQHHQYFTFTQESQVKVFQNIVTYLFILLFYFFTFGKSVRLQKENQKSSIHNTLLRKISLKSKK